MNPTTQSVSFSSGGQTCCGLLFTPEGAPTPGPCVVGAHGFGGTVDAGLAPYAERFAQEGIRTLFFDYRHFGLSEGEPRQLLSIRRQLRDYAAAVAFVRTLPEVDPDRIALFGTSFSGGHAVRVAANDDGIAAVVAQCPMLDGAAALLNLVRYAGAGMLLRIAGHGLRDLCRALTGRDPHRVPIVGPPGSLAAMTTADAEPGYRAIAPPGWRNEVCARIGLSLPLYRPGAQAGRVRCPVLLQICERDAVAPVAAVRAAARRLGSRATVQSYDLGHFDVYVGEAFNRSAADQTEFLQQALASRQG